jgi:hypothetical protein
MHRHLAELPLACLTEAQLRDKMAIDLDGVDHFRSQAPDVLDVSLFFRRSRIPTVVAMPHALSPD